MAASNTRLPGAVRTAALALWIDTITAEVVTALRGAAIRPLLLKGPSIADWLYGDRAARPYDDTDLLVAPSAYRQAGDVLRGLGFRPRAYSWHGDSETWSRPETSCVDLHRSLIGVSAPPARVWRELAAQTQTLPVGEIDVEILGVPARTLHMALHAAQHGVDAGRPLEDLARALRVADERTWREAAGLARRIDALPAFAAGVRLDPEGARLADRLKLPAEPPPAVALRVGSDVPVAIALESLASEDSLRARARLLLRALSPSPGYMRHWSALHGTRLPEAVRRGTPGLWLAYLWRPIWVLLRLPKAIAAVRRARQARTEG